MNRPIQCTKGHRIFENGKWVESPGISLEICVPAGTQVIMADGTTVPVEDVGDRQPMIINKEDT